MDAFPDYGWLGPKSVTFCHGSSSNYRTILLRLHIVQIIMPNEDRTSSDEASPLLGSRPGHRRFASVASLKSIHVPQVHGKSTIINLICLTVLLASGAGGFLQIPQARLIEDVLCHEYYDKAQSLNAPIDEELCKVESIQGDLAYILAITSALSAGVGLVATFPWSFVADRYTLYFLSIIT